MAISYNPRIVTDGLVLALDAGNTKSYPGSGTTWTDLTGNGYNATIRGTNRFSSTNGGIFDFGVNSQIADWIEMPRTALNTLGGSYTLETWLAPRTSDGARYWHSMATSGNNNAQIYQQNASTLGPYQGTLNVQYTDGEWMQFVSVRSGTDTGLVYKNGANPYSSGAIRDISSIEGWVLNQEQDSVLGGYDSSQNFWGAFAIVRLYNRAFTPQEIQQNFNATRSRFSI